MKVLVGVAVVVGVVAVDMAAVMVVDMIAVMEVDMIAVMEVGMIETPAEMRNLLVTVDQVEVKLRFEKLILGGLLKGVVVMVDHRVVSVVNAVVVIVMAKKGRGIALAGCLSVEAEQDEGNKLSLIMSFYWTFFFCTSVMSALK